MRGISRYNHEGYPDPTAHKALTKIYREQLKAERSLKERERDARNNASKEENQNGQKD